MKRNITCIRETHADAFHNLIDYIKMYVIDEKRAEYITSIHSRYERFLQEHNIDYTPFNTQSLTEKILKTFKDEVLISKSS